MMVGRQDAVEAGFRGIDEKRRDQSLPGEQFQRRVERGLGERGDGADETGMESPDRRMTGVGRKRFQDGHPLVGGLDRPGG